MPGKALKIKRLPKITPIWTTQKCGEKLLEFQNGSTAQVTFYLPQMHCVSCIWLLENLYKLDAGVTHARVNFLKKTVTIQFNAETGSLPRLAALLSAIGYAPDINLGDVEGQKRPALNAAWPTSWAWRVLPSATSCC